MRELSAAVSQAAEAIGVTRVLVIDSEGPSFTVGGDLVHFTGHGSSACRRAVGRDRPYHQALTVLSKLPVPVGYAVQGTVAGGGPGSCGAPISSSRPMT